MAEVTVVETADVRRHGLGTESATLNATTRNANTIPVIVILPQAVTPDPVSDSYLGDGWYDSECNSEACSVVVETVNSRPNQG